MIVRNILDIIENLGFKWQGNCYTCGFYRIKKCN